MSRTAFTHLIQSSLDPKFGGRTITLRDGSEVQVCRHMRDDHVSCLKKLLKNSGIELSIPLMISFMQQCKCGDKEAHNPNFPGSVIDEFKIPEHIEEVVKKFFKEKEDFDQAIDNSKMQFNLASSASQRAKLEAERLAADAKKALERAEQFAAEAKKAFERAEQFAAEAKKAEELFKASKE
jgi:hypothetical protein